MAENCKNEKSQQLERNKVVQENQIRLLQKYKETHKEKDEESQKKINDLMLKTTSDDIALQAIKSLLSKAQSDLEASRAESLRQAKLYEKELDMKDRKEKQMRETIESMKKPSSSGGDGGGDGGGWFSFLVQKAKDGMKSSYSLLRIGYTLISWLLWLLYWLLKNILLVLTSLFFTLVIWLIIRLTRRRK